MRTSLCKAIVVLLVGAAARELHTFPVHPVPNVLGREPPGLGDLVAPEAHQMVVEKLGGVVGVDFEYREKGKRAKMRSKPSFITT